MNYIEGIVRILETPKQSFSNKNIIISRVRVQLPQLRSTQVVKLIFWGSLARDISNYYQINDYILIEGYLSTRNTKNLNSKVSQKIEITVLKVYPVFLNSEYLLPSRSN